MRISRQTYLAETSKCILVLCFKREREREREMIILYVYCKTNQLSKFLNALAFTEAKVRNLVHI
jgi:hypothetical protein